MKSVGELSVKQAHIISCKVETIENICKAIREDVLSVSKYDKEIEDSLRTIRVLSHNASHTLIGGEE